MRRLAIVLAPILLTVVACSTVPYTERTRVIFLPESHERALGAQAYEEITGKAALSHNPSYVNLVERAGRRIAAIASEDLKEGERDDFEWEFRVIDEPKTVNAFCLPGGKIAFYTGILPICKDETGVAVVMGHEVAHALARHGGERISQAMVIEAGAIAVGVALSSKSEETQGAVLAAYGIGTGIALALPFSRKHELEADHIGLMLMAKAGYDPREAPKFWKRMMDAGGGAPPEFLSTHPDHERRVEELELLVPDAMVYYQQAIGKQVDYHKRTIRAGN